MTDEQYIQEFITNGLYEDTRGFDHTSLACIPAEDTSEAYLLIKDNGVLAGIHLAEKILKYVDPVAEVEILINDGEEVAFGDIAMRVKANTQALLKAERLMLNIMQRMCGIATLSRRFSFEVKDLPVKILDTRKTTPLIRFFEKWAVRIGGCYNYRDGLYDWIMIKDNHVDAAGSIKAAIERVHGYLKENKLDLGITVEVRDMTEIRQVLEVGGITRIMFDNFELSELAKAVELVDRRFETEASGGVRLNTVRSIALTGVDYISVGGLTHSSTSMDISFKIKKGS
ncbi:MAG: carboxylating nicotinate-nucleotide diphosphorylase [Bacteroidetes bacterium]|jgi:nicotinate-nucleotide pyrophosphorylase (carboxylating)|nr:carboxylating nicotinate-nucleotide diphosphorylase [Bacteroidota bacterium]MCO5276437.1 carboxylating nicotinate-nucleotide diphosphorylase [Saprospiraceae bacterium]HMT77186.1 carboxylating nicotinate-nucleotide diphosphorylase [Saprospiraceae bacterium]HQU96124.1 carboxylating nicotinate-nucleotide diphosphorylase [Saprospiraceae bacterium]HQW94959.1 carboxylating nicotinate-nucleotide diphosphorylase [Saprospiraceae bacterium]